MGRKRIHPKITDEMREELREAILELLQITRLALRPSEILRHLSHDERFMFWPNCMHVTVQLRILQEPDEKGIVGKVRKIWLPVGDRTKFGIPRVYGWCVTNLTHKEIRQIREETLRNEGPIELTQCEVLK